VHIYCTLVSRIERWNLILERLSGDGGLEVTAVAEALNVSTATIRRDLRALEEQRLLSRTHGGAMSSGLMYELPLRYKGDRRKAEKLRIAAEAAKRVSEGMVIGLVGGTTTTEVARAVSDRPGLTVVTNAINIASELAIRPNLKLMVTGGVARPQSYELSGPLAESTLAGLNLDLVFTGVDGISVERGITTHDEGEARTDRALIARARTTIVVTDSSKLGRAAFSIICGLDEVDELIVDAQADAQYVADLRDAGMTVTLV